MLLKKARLVRRVPGTIAGVNRAVGNLEALLGACASRFEQDRGDESRES
jgi:hypothetical protein